MCDLCSQDMLMAFEMIIFALMFLKSFSYRGERAAPLRPPPPPTAFAPAPVDCLGVYP
jgi:hypothetical protein